MQTHHIRETFPTATGGNIYSWTDATTTFETATDGIYIIAVTASAKNAAQNKTTDDDDLRMSLDGYQFGKYEIHKEKVSWKGFGTAGSWDGASLQGGTKTVYFFVQLAKGEHKIEFTADGAPELKKIEVLKLEKDETFELKKLKPVEQIETDKKGIPWMSFVFLGLPSKNFTLDVQAQSAKTKCTTDGDNLKVVVNGKILQNTKAPTSNKYKNFYFSGALSEFDILNIGEDLNKFEDSVELWYDGIPKITDLKIVVFGGREFYETRDLDVIVDNFQKIALVARAYFWIKRYRYSYEFLSHALKSQKKLVFTGDDQIAKKLQRDDAYKNIILPVLRERLRTGILKGELWPSDFPNSEVNFNSKDLATSIHGIKKIEYIATRHDKKSFTVDIKIFDIYDFSQVDVPNILFHPISYIKSTVNNIMDRAEEMGILYRFELEVSFRDHV
jgi:hypothetical protein